MKTTIKNSIRSLLVSLVIACFGLLPAARAVVPAPDGGYPGFTTAEGTNALLNLNIGIQNTALGFSALVSDTSGSYNVAVGSLALGSNTTGLFNMAVGTQALFKNNADANMAIGFRVLYFNTTGSDNTGIGTGALYKNTTASFNTAIGSGALNSNTTGGTLGTDSVFHFYLVGPNTAVGSRALNHNITSSGNTAVGYQALGSMVSGFNGGASDLGISTAVGFQALAKVNGTNTAANDAFGYQALTNLTDGNENVAIGSQAGSNLTTGDGNIYIGAFQSGSATESFTTRIGNIAGNSQPIVGTVDGVTIDLSTSKLGHGVSSRRYKEDIKPMERASEALFALKPVTFHYKKEIDPTQTVDFGLIAEEVAAVNPGLAVRDAEGKISNYRRDAVNAMLLNEFLKEHRKVEELEATVAQQQKGMEVLAERLKEQAAQIQKVSAQLEVKKPAPKVVRNNP